MMYSVGSWGEAFTDSLLSVSYGVLDFLPKFILAVAIFILGWIFAYLVEKVIEGIFKSFKVDSLLKTSGLEDVIERSGHKLNSGRFVGSLVKWFIIVIFLLASFDIFGLTQVNDFLGKVVLGYLPNVIIAVFVIMVSAVIADATDRIITASSRAAHIKAASFLGTIARWSIWIFAVLTALYQLGVAPALMQTLFLGIIVALSLAFGLSFGLGGKEVAAKILENVVHKVSDKE